MAVAGRCRIIIFIDRNVSFENYQMNLLIRSAKIISPKSPYHGQKVDLLIKDGIFAEIAAHISLPPGFEEITFQNLHLSEGWFDSSVCFGEPGYEERETIANGLSVAALSGFTDILLQPNTFPHPDNGSQIESLKAKAQGHATRLHPMGTLTQAAEGVALAQLHDMKMAGAAAFGDYKNPITKSLLLKMGLLYAQSFDGLLCAFPLDESLLAGGMIYESPATITSGLKAYPPIAEDLQIARDIAVLRYTGGKLHFPTVSRVESVKMIDEAKREGLDVSCSVSLMHLSFTEKSILSFDTNYKIMPPLSDEKNREGLREALVDGRIDMVTSDHLPMNHEAKHLDFCAAEFGASTLECSFGILNSLFGTERAVSLLTQGKSRFGAPQFRIEKGQPVSVTLFNPEPAYTLNHSQLLSKSKNCPYIGAPLKGFSYGIISQGKSLFSKKDINP